VRPWSRSWWPSSNTDGLDVFDFQQGIPYPDASIDIGPPKAAGQFIPQSTTYSGGVAMIHEATTRVFLVTGDEGNDRGQDAWFFVWHPDPEG